jgi:hypothetical protein
MEYFGERKSTLLILLLLSGCGEAGPECESSDTRDSVVNIVSSDSHNALVKYAAKNSSAVQSKLSSARTDAEKSGILEEAVQRASYTLGDTISTNSRGKDKRGVTCSGVLSATVDDATAHKQVDFKVERAPDGTISISVTPFKF